jgi:hypothetical protein
MKKEKVIQLISEIHCTDDNSSGFANYCVIQLTKVAISNFLKDMRFLETQDRYKSVMVHNPPMTFFEHKPLDEHAIGKIIVQKVDSGNDDWHIVTNMDFSGIPEAHESNDGCPQSGNAEISKFNRMYLSAHEKHSNLEYTMPSISREMLSNWLKEFK